jgi:hypothetical protein
MSENEGHIFVTFEDGVTPGLTVQNPPGALAMTIYAYCRGVGAEGLPTPERLAWVMADLVAVIQEHAWDDAADEAFALGWLHDAALADVRARNPYRNRSGR